MITVFSHGLFCLFLFLLGFLSTSKQPDAEGLSSSSALMASLWEVRPSWSICRLFDHCCSILRRSWSFYNCKGEFYPVCGRQHMFLWRSSVKFATASIHTHVCNSMASSLQVRCWVCWIRCEHGFETIPFFHRSLNTTYELWGYEKNNYTLNSELKNSTIRASLEGRLI